MHPTRIHQHEYLVFRHWETKSLGFGTCGTVGLECVRARSVRKSRQHFVGQETVQT